MQPERQLSVALTGVAAALVIPQVVGLTRQPPTPAGGVLVTGTVLGALGVLLGCLVVSGHPARAARILGFALWSLIGLAFAGSAGLALVRSATWVMRIVFGASAVLPLLGPVLTVAREARESSR